VVGVAHDASGIAPCASATVRRLLSALPAGLLPFCAGVPAIAVGQPANCATWFKLTVALLPSGRRPVELAFFAICDPSALPFVGVGHGASCAITCSDVIAVRLPPMRCFIARWA